MNVAIYGANLTGYYITKLVEFRGEKIICYIDRNPENKYADIDNSALIYSNIESVPENIINSLDKVIVALGNENEALLVVQNLKKYLSCEIVTAYQEPFNFFYQKLKDAKKNKIFRRKRIL